MKSSWRSVEAKRKPDFCAANWNQFPKAGSDIFPKLPAEPLCRERDSIAAKTQVLNDFGAQNLAKAFR